MGAMASQISASPLFTQSFIQGQIKKKYQSSASLAFVRGIHRWPVNSPHIWPVTRQMFPFDDVIMSHLYHGWQLEGRFLYWNVPLCSYQCTRHPTTGSMLATTRMIYNMFHTICIWACCALSCLGLKNNLYLWIHIILLQIYFICTVPVK